MKVAVFSIKPYDQRFLESGNRQHGHALSFLESRLTLETTSLACGHEAVCAFVNDVLDRDVLEQLASEGIRLIALRCAGFNHVDLKAADELNIKVMLVPAYSPFAVGEHAAGLMLTLNRKYHRAFNRVRESNFALDGLMGFDMHGKTVGIIGTGRIGSVVARIMHGFGCHLLGYDQQQNPQCVELGMRYTSLEEIYAESDIITLHCPLVPQTHHIINAQAMAQMKDGVMLINTGRGALIDTAAAIAALKSGKIGHLGLDVYEEEENLFFEDLSDQIMQDDVFARLLTFHNVLITSHQAFFTREAMTTIAATTLQNISHFERGEPSGNEVGGERLQQK